MEKELPRIKNIEFNNDGNMIITLIYTNGKEKQLIYIDNEHDKAIPHIKDFENVNK